MICLSLQKLIKNVTDHQKHLKNLLEINITESNGKFLGLPLPLGINRKEVLVEVDREAQEDVARVKIENPILIPK